MNPYTHLDCIVWSMTLIPFKCYSEEYDTMLVLAAPTYTYLDVSVCEVSESILVLAVPAYIHLEVTVRGVRLPLSLLQQDTPIETLECVLYDSHTLVKNI